VHPLPTSSGRSFNAPWGPTVTIISLLVGALLLVVSVLGISRFLPEPTLVHLLAAAAPLLILVGTALFTVRGFRVEGRYLCVRRLFWETRMDMAHLQSAEVDLQAMKSSLRLAGNGGLFALAGLFRNRLLGTYRAFVTDPNRCVVLRLPKRPIVVSPDRPADFVVSVKAALGLE